VSRHRFFVEPGALSRSTICLRGDLAHRLGHVLRLAPGDLIYLLDGSGCEVTAEVTELQPSRVLARPLGTSFPETEPHTAVTLCPALLPTERFEWVLEKGTELGVSRFLPLLAERNTALPSRDKRANERKRERWQVIVRAAAEQSHRTRLPVVEAPVTLAAALESAATPVIMAWESSTESVARALAPLGGSTDSVTLIVGPEGGFTDQEAAMAEGRGVSLVSLGPRVLRAETAAIALATLVLYACGDLESAAPASPR